ncbi:RsfS/YbeB/iojap family protein [Aspergillus brunneoviolaceus CBS 621.78]|uniref:Uncharacterized protein n=1 Tax=Aspergillus brunneoviolaceus CBS 621.78 TaxID=1450534 RepID=A0ACD1GBU1_9EURO|nr:hypothetical protein BO95DRAFT_441921 [Aspergillus brunneoviolaceus CBS 621.78]RAH46700.1 hypothetical protein BO95DRAFT_441921 [Aspergillus brunneoviolaceus CBS 621.78]
MLNRALLRTPWLRPAIFSAPHPSISATAASAPRFPTLYATTRPLTSAPFRQSEHPPTTPSTPPSETAALPSQDPEPATTTTTTAPEPPSHIPWYLQDEPDVPATRPIISGEQIPALPENPPALLAALLEYTFKDLGLDGLKLLDLRGLDTPPALGANVIMIVGTARSVKHLNVSADRLCRWLRATYKLAPFADGLLGRNELKIKLRRKAKRARLASKAGTLVDDKDDGITTGWICVNAGIVEEAPLADEVAAAQEAAGFEGFGNAGWGTRVVVQIFTEEKRAEVDLEGLWEKNLARVGRQRERERAEREDGEEWL